MLCVPNQLINKENVTIKLIDLLPFLQNFTHPPSSICEFVIYGYGYYWST